MIRNLLTIIVLFVLSGCSTVSEVSKAWTYKYEAPKFNFAFGTRVGIIDLLKPHPIHKNVKALSKKSTFEKDYIVDWHIREYAEDLVTSELQNDGRYEVVLIEGVGEPLLTYQSGMRFPDISGRHNFPHGVEPEVGSYLDSLSRQHNLDVIIVISEFFILGKTGFACGYGLYTTQGASDRLAKAFGTTHAFAAIGLKAFTTNPATYIGGAKPTKLVPMRMEWPEDIHNIPVSDFNRAEPIVKEEIKKLVLEALKDVNLVQRDG